MSADKRTMLKKRSEFPLENILASYLDEREIKLSPLEETLKLRYETIFKNLIKKDSILSVIKIQKKAFDISSATAYRDLHNAQQIFGKVKSFDKDAWRFIQIERKRRLIKLAMKAYDYETAAKLERDIDNLLDFGAEDPSFNKEKIENLEITVSLPKSTINQINKITKGGVVDFNDWQAEDVDFEDVTDD